jgi:hypothetical protein
VFRAEDPALHAQVTAGDKIKFDAENVNGNTRSQKSRRRNSDNFVAARRRINERALNRAFRLHSSCQ